MAATSESFFRILGVSLDTSANVIFADQNGDVSTVNRTTGILNFVAGDLANANAYYGDNGPALSAGLHDPWDAIEDSAGNLYIADHGNNVIRRVDHITGVITAYAGNNATGGAFSGDNGPATNASLYAPLYLVFDGSGNLCFSDSGNNRVRRIDHTTGIITTVAGNGTSVYSGDGGPAIGASLSMPAGLAFDTSGNLYIADLLHDVIREVNTSGIISTVAGNHSTGGTFGGDGGQATLASLNSPYGIAVYNNGLYIADTLNFRIRRVELVPPATTNLESEAVNQTTTASTVGTRSLPKTPTEMSSEQNTSTASVKALWVWSRPA